MPKSGKQAVVVAGVDATTGSKRAVRWAVLEARRLGTPLLLVHVTPGETSGVPAPMVPPGTLRSYGLELLEDARDLARSVSTDPDLELDVDTRLLSEDTAVGGLVGASQEATLLVLGAERRSLLGQVWTGDVVAGVAARASCPVVVLPPEWEPGEPRGVVAVGIKDSEHSGALIAAGMSLAHHRGATLLLVHAWRAPSGYDDLIAARTFIEDYTREQTGLIEEALLAHRRRHQDVVVRIEVVHAQPAFALVDASAAADRILIARPRHGGAVHHLGGTARALLREARCAVEVHSLESR